MALLLLIPCLFVMVALSDSPGLVLTIIVMFVVAIVIAGIYDNRNKKNEPNLEAELLKMQIQNGDFDGAMNTVNRPIRELEKKEAKKNIVKGAVTGGIIGGPVGAVIGAEIAKEENKDKL